MNNNLKENILLVTVNVCRLVLAVVFIFSGFVKAVDPYGTFYKISDYIAAFGFGGFLPDYILMLFSVVLSSLEFVLGIGLLFAIKRITTTYLTFFMMLFMTPLTLYLALENPVSDCGCFGDAVHLTNWQTFFKNVVLLAMSVVILLNFKRMKSVMTWRVRWIVLLYSVVFIVGISVYSIRYLPILDFRPFKIGVNIKEGMGYPEGVERTEYLTTFIMEKDGERKEFTLEEYPSDTAWHFVDSRTVVVKEGYEPPITNFSITRIDGDEEDITDSVLDNAGYTFLLVMPEIDKASDSNIDRINGVYDYCIDNGYGFYCLTASTMEMITYWKEYMGAEYDFCLTDDRTLKAVIRSNPGLVLLKDGVVVNKWSNNMLPSDMELNGRLEDIEIGIMPEKNYWKTLMNVLLLYVLPLSLIIGVEAHWLRRNNIKE